MNRFIIWALNLPPQASTFAKHIDWLHAFVFSTAVVGSLGITFVAVFFIAKYRRTGPPRPKRSGYASTTGEALIMSSILAMFLLWWSIGFQQYDHMHEVPPGALVVHVTAKQWMWKFEHDSGEIELGTLTVPRGIPVEVVMTSRDVIHSFYVPAFRLKEDVIPGRYVTAWFQARETGDFPVRCAEMCGAGHARMLGTIHVVPLAEYDGALAPSRPSSPAARRGMLAAARAGCLSCHSLDGAPRIGPSWRELAGSTVRMTGGEEVVADDAYLTQSMVFPSARVVEGYADVMPRFQGVLSPADVADIIELIHSLRGPP